MTTKENYLHEFFRILFANRQLVKRVFLVFAVIALLLPLVLKQSFDITAEVIVQSKSSPRAIPTPPWPRRPTSSFRLRWPTWRPRATSCVHPR